MKIHKILSSIFISLSLGSCWSQSPNYEDEINNHMLLSKIPISEYSPETLYYSSQAMNGETATDVLENSKKYMVDFISSIPESKIKYKYGNFKWTVAEVVQHAISYENIMYEKCLIAIAEAPLKLEYSYYTQSGTAAEGNNKSKAQLLEEYTTIRNKMIALMNRLTEEEQTQLGKMDGFKLSIRSFALCASGHQQHHLGVIKERYLE